MHEYLQKLFKKQSHFLSGLKTLLLNDVGYHFPLKSLDEKIDTMFNFKRSAICIIPVSLLRNTYDFDIKYVDSSILSLLTKLNKFLLSMAFSF